MQISDEGARMDECLQTQRLAWLRKPELPTEQAEAAAGAAAVDAEDVEVAVAVVAATVAAHYLWTLALLTVAGQVYPSWSRKCAGC